LSKRTIILKNNDRELPVEIVVEPTSNTIHVRVEWIDTQLLAELIQEQFAALVNDDGYKIWLQTVSRQNDVGIEIREATFTVEMLEGTLIMKPLEWNRYDA